MGRLVGYFVRGLVLLVPVAVTAYVCWWIFVTLDGWLKPVLELWTGRELHGAGFVINILLITLVGFLGSTLITRSFFVLFERLLARVPGAADVKTTSVSKALSVCIAHTPMRGPVK